MYHHLVEGHRPEEQECQVCNFYLGIRVVSRMRALASYQLQSKHSFQTIQ